MYPGFKKKLKLTIIVCSRTQSFYPAPLTPTINNKWLIVSIVMHINQLVIDRESEEI